MSYWVKVHHSATGEVVVAVCDKELLGTRIKLSDSHYIDVSEEFYGGYAAEWEQVEELMESATIINLLGNCAVQAAIERGLVIREAVVELNGVKHVQIMR